ncbi:pyrroloquinoline quinone biosynthesis protein PqqB [Nocardia colli]|uniref:pyrroloquinoline quinone biosynthesis protein PqqB n=1 Tax=Nocardia colli TaxID=2545717 RepID=UPI0035DC0C9A
MRVILLGTAAGGGFPQWNCACALCRCARAGTLPSRRQECVAVSGNARDWWLLNASPDIRTQLLDTPVLWPGPAPRDTPLRGVLLTDAEVDHTLGLAVLRGADGFVVHATAPVRDALELDLRLRGMLDRYHPWTWRDHSPRGGVELAGGLGVSAHPVSAKAPKYVTAASTDLFSVTALRIEDSATGGVLIYAPCLAIWPAGLDELLDGADCALLDGTFFSTDELATAVRSSEQTAGQPRMGHLPVTGKGGTLAALARYPGLRRIYTHLNNTNPLLDPASSARAQIQRAGVEIRPDGFEFTV